MNTVVLSTVINFCTNDFRFLRACIEGAHPFSHSILVNVCDHYFDGTEENYALLEHAYRSFPECVFIEYPFDPVHSYRRFTPHFPEHLNWRHEWHNTGRWIAFHFLPQECNFILFLDVDEVVDGTRFRQWLNQNAIMPYSALRLAAYWYFREARYRADCCDDISLLVNKKALHPDHLWSTDERMGIYIGLQGKKGNGVLGLDHAPLVDHYSWVRTKEELRKKFLSWSHHWERSWEELLEAEYAGPFQGKDFIRGYTYHEVEPLFDPLVVEIPDVHPISLQQHVKNLSIFPNVIRVDRETMQRKELLELVKQDYSLNVYG
jgi:hypothetical protein